MANKKVWSKKVAPENYPDFGHGKVSPVTRAELGNRFQTMALRHLHINKNGYMDRYKAEIQLFTETYDLGDVLWLHYRFIFAKNFREVVQYIKQKGLYVFDIWGYVPTSNRADFGEYRAAFAPSGNAHQYLLKTLGPKFLGWDNGEQDGRFFHHYAPLFCPAPQTRREAYEGFSRYFRRLGNHLENYLVTLLGMYFPHYMAHFGNHRLLGAETAQALPSVPPWYAVIRGAGKQYGILWFGNASVYNRWGYKTYNKQEANGQHLSEGGPDKGTSLELLKRLWYVEYMYGCCMMGFEQGHILGINTEEYLAALEGRTKDSIGFPKKPSLTPIGQLQVECTRWCKEHPNVGIQYTPAAILMDFYAGWAPPRTVYNHEGSYLVWGNIYYEKGDHQIDAFFRLVYPTYEDCSYYRDERGFLTPTPAGDIFDVLLSNVSEEILHQYEVVILLGEIKLEGKLLEKIIKFLIKGGKVIVFLNQLSEGARKIFNVKSKGTIKESNHARQNGNTFKERLFQYEAANVPGADILAVSGEKHPLIFKKRYGAGEINIIVPDFGLNKKGNKRPPPGIKEVEKPIPGKYHLLECVKKFLLDCLTELNLVEIEGAPIQYITNVTADPRKIYLTLSNNRNQQWEGKIKVKGRQNISVKDMFSNKILPCSNGEFKAGVAPLNVGIFLVETKSPIITFKKSLKKKEETDFDIAVWSRANPNGTIWQNVETTGRSSFASIELCVTQLSGMDDGELSLLAEELKAGALAVSALNLAHAQTPYVDNNITSQLSWTMEENKKFLSRSLQIANVLGCDTIILSTGKVLSRQSLEDAFSLTVDVISEFGSEAKKSDITLLLEPAPLRAFNKAEDLIRLVDKISLPNVGIALDTGHSYWFDGTPLDSLKKLGDRIKYVNINSPLHCPGSPLIDKHLMADADKGCFDKNMLKLFLKGLREINYRGPLCINSFFPEPLIQNLQKEYNKLQNILKGIRKGKT